MVSPELLRRYPFFAGLSLDQITTMAKAADEMSVEAGHYFFHEGEEVDHFYLILEGEVAIVVQLLQKGKPVIVAELAEKEREVTTTTLGHGEIFAWSALVPPHKSAASGKALTPCRVIAFDSRELRKRFDADPAFGYIMMQRAAQGVQSRLRAMRTEFLAYAVEDEREDV